MKQMDIRVPMGGMFCLLGLLLTGYGLWTYHSEAYTRSLGINVNLWWGGAILLFGIVLLAFSWHAARRVKE